MRACAGDASGPAPWPDRASRLSCHGGASRVGAGWTVGCLESVPRVRCGRAPQRKPSLCEAPGRSSRVEGVAGCGESMQHAPLRGAPRSALADWTVLGLRGRWCGVCRRCTSSTGHGALLLHARATRCDTCLLKRRAAALALLRLGAARRCCARSLRPAASQRLGFLCGGWPKRARGECAGGPTVSSASNASTRKGPPVWEARSGEGAAPDASPAHARVTRWRKLRLVRRRRGR